MPENPKEAAGSKKPQLHLIPPAAEVALANVLELGAKKYGVANWRQDPIKVCTYISAAKRHLAAILSGEDVDPESGESHWAHVMACGAIVIDAGANACLIDDRPKSKLCGCAPCKIARDDIGPHPSRHCAVSPQVVVEDVDLPTLTHRESTR